MHTFLDMVAQNSQIAKWYNMLNETEKHSLVPIFNQVLTTTKFYNDLFPGFEIYITGSSLNLIDHSYNDIDLMVVIPSEELKKVKLKILANTRDIFKNRDFSAMVEQINDPKVKILGLIELLSSVKDSLNYSLEITDSNRDALLRRLGSSNEVTRLLMDPERELTAIKVRVEGMLEAEKNNPPVESNGTHAYQFGSLVEVFLKNIATVLGGSTREGQPQFYFQWYKSFAEGYGRIAGENNCHIYPRVKCTPVHLFLTTGVNQKKAMEKKESFMLEYYTEQERMRPVKLF